MKDIPKTDQIYRHFKGDLYKIITPAVHVESGERMIVYQALYGDFKVYVQELATFMARVDRRKYPGADQKECFRLVTELVGQGAGPSLQSVSSVERNGAEEETGDAEHIKETTTEAGSRQDEGKAADSIQAEPDRRDELRAAEVKTDEPGPEKEQTDTQEPPLDPFLLDFLDADTYRERLNLLAALHVRLTDDMVNTMAVSLDVEIKEGDIEERYEALKNCLLTLEKYECNRLR